MAVVRYMVGLGRHCVGQVGGPPLLYITGHGGATVEDGGPAWQGTG